jgi:hypothetical protein
VKHGLKITLSGKNWNICGSCLPSLQKPRRGLGSLDPDGRHPVTAERSVLDTDAAIPFVLCKSVKKIELRRVEGRDLCGKKSLSR